MTIFMVVYFFTLAGLLLWWLCSAVYNFVKKKQFLESLKKHEEAGL